jgi:DNA-binding protein HU-beta
MNKRNLVDALALRTKLSRAAALRSIDDVFGCLTDCMKADDSITITGFGTFTKKRRAARTARNPATGVLMDIAPSTTISFRASPALRRVVDITCADDPAPAAAAPLVEQAS